MSEKSGEAWCENPDCSVYKNRVVVTVDVLNSDSVEGHTIDCSECGKPITGWVVDDYEAQEKDR